MQAQDENSNPSVQLPYPGQALQPTITQEKQKTKNKPLHLQGEKRGWVRLSEAGWSNPDLEQPGDL